MPLQSLGAAPRTRSKHTLLSVQGDPSAFTPVFSDQLHQPKRLASATRHPLRQKARSPSRFLINGRGWRRKRTRGKNDERRGASACRSRSGGSKEARSGALTPGTGGSAHRMPGPSPQLTCFQNNQTAPGDPEQQQISPPPLRLVLSCQHARAPFPISPRCLPPIIIFLPSSPLPSPLSLSRPLTSLAFR